MTTTDERLARWRDTWHKIAASEFAGETVYSHEAFGVVLQALADAETRAARDAAIVAAVEAWDKADEHLLAVKRGGAARHSEYWDAAEANDRAVIALKTLMRDQRPEERARKERLLAAASTATPRPDAGQGVG